MEIATWIVSIMAGMSVLAIWSVRSMPWRLRLSLIIPHLYFCVLYAVPMGLELRSLLARGGLVAMFATDIIVATIQHLHDKRRRTWKSKRL